MPKRKSAFPQFATHQVIAPSAPSHTALSLNLVTEMDLLRLLTTALPGQTTTPARKRMRRRA